MWREGGWEERLGCKVSELEGPEKRQGNYCLLSTCYMLSTIHLIITNNFFFLKYHPIGQVKPKKREVTYPKPGRQQPTAYRMQSLRGPLEDRCEVFRTTEEWGPLVRQHLASVSDCAPPLSRLSHLPVIRQLLLHRVVRGISEPMYRQYLALNGVQ